MADFPKGAGCTKFLLPMEKISIINFGYNNFEYVKPQQSFWEQKHYTLHFVVKGKGFLEIGGKKHAISRHCLFAIPPRVSMKYYPDENDKWAYVWFVIDGKGAERFFENIGANISTPVIKTQYGTYISSLLSDLFSEGENSANTYKVTSVFYDVLHCITDNREKSSQLLKSIIDRNFQEHNFTVSKLCEDCGISHAQLCRIFKKDYGTSPKRYLTDKRMGYAKKLLESTDLKIEAVAYSCGYRDCVNFMKEFKKKIGISAGEYRQKCRESTS